MVTTTSRFPECWCGSSLLETVRRHVGRYLGPVDLVLHEAGARVLPITLLHVPPSDDRPFHALVTCGMSARPMKVPRGLERLARAELFLLLDRDWPCARRLWRDRRWGWPPRELRRLARYPHETSTWLACGQTIGNNDPPVPYAPGMPFCAALVANPVSTADGFGKLRLSTGVVRFYQFVPLFDDELRFAHRHSSNALIARFAQLQIEDVIHAARPSACRLPSGMPIRKTSWLSDRRGASTFLDAGGV